MRYRGRASNHRLAGDGDGDIGRAYAVIYRTPPSAIN